MFSNLKPAEIILILLVVLLLFGAKRLPDTARGLGRSLRIFKAETRGLREDDEASAEKPGEPPRQITATPAETQAAEQPAAERPAAEQPRSDR